MIKVYYNGWGNTKRRNLHHYEDKAIYHYGRNLKTKTSLSWRKSVTKSDPFWKKVAKYQWERYNYEDMDPCEMGRFICGLVKKLPARFRSSGYIQIDWSVEESGRFRVASTYFQSRLHRSTGIGDVPSHFATRWPDRITKRFLSSHGS